MKSIKFGAIPDYYTLGVFCGKTGLINEAVKHRSALRKPTKQLKLFGMGIDDAKETSFDDIAFDIYQMRQATVDKFDDYIRDKSGEEVLAQITKALSDAHDWESKKMKAGGGEVIDRMMRSKTCECDS